MTQASKALQALAAVAVLVAAAALLNPSAERHRSQIQKTLAERSPLAGALGLGALEEMLATSSATGQFCHGDTPTLADCCLVPQVFNARRFGCPTQGYPTIERIVATCEQLPAFAQAAPGLQPDAE